MTLRRRRSSLLCISIQPYEIAVCRARRQGRQAVASAVSRAPIPAALVRAEPERAGQELRRALKAARIGKEPVAVCLPLNWAFTAEIALPDLAEPDLQEFVRIEAERRFPLAPEDLAIKVAHIRAARNGLPGRRALLVGVALEHLARIDTMLRAARLRAISMTFGIAALAGAYVETPCTLIRAGAGFVDLAIVPDGAPPILRNLIWREDGAPEDVPPDARELARQLRITLAQLDPEQSERTDTALLHGDAAWRAGTANFAAIEESLAGLDIVLRDEGASADDGQAPAALLAAAGEVMLRGAAEVELITKRKAHVPAFASRFSGRTARLAIGTACGAAALLAVSFGMQARQLADLDAQWSAISPGVEQVKLLQERVRKYRSWYDDSVASLAIPVWLAEAFPNEGSVWIKTLHVKDRTIATCSGVAANRNAWMEVLDKLGKNKDLDDLQVVQTRGDAPFSFTLTFRWKGKDAGGL